MMQYNQTKATRLFYFITSGTSVQKHDIPQRARASKYIMCEKALLWFFQTDVHTCIVYTVGPINTIYRTDTGWFNSCYDKNNHKKTKIIHCNSKQP